MNLHSLKNTKGARKGRMRVGRGNRSGKGKTCGRGHKGQMARKGHKHKSGFEGGQMKLIRRIPKRGFKNPVRMAMIPVNLSDLARLSGVTEVDAKVLAAAGILHREAGRIKILGKGELKQKLTVKAHGFSASAKAAIEAVGGTCEVLQ
jgi:large subunit ribosomal protein L15